MPTPTRTKKRITKAEYEKCKGIRFQGSRIGKNDWDFRAPERRKLNRKFMDALDRIGDGERKKIILKLVGQFQRINRLTERQWRFLGVLMTLEDPKCHEAPKEKIVLSREDGLKKAFLGTFKNRWIYGSVRCRGLQKAGK